MSEALLRSRRVLGPEGLTPATVHLRGGRIEGVLGYHDQPPGATLHDLGELVVAPGVVDSHVHINEPGRTEWEGFLTATQAAAAGGITTVVDMPLNSIPATTTAEAAEAKWRTLRDQMHVDVAFWGGVVPGNAGALADLGRFGVPGCKCFLCPSGVEEFPPVGRAELELAMPRLRDAGLTLLVHAELSGPIDAAEAALRAEGADPRAYRTYLRSRPPEAEDEAIALIIELAERHQAPAHIVHLSSASALPRLRDAKARGVPITAETCLHYLAFTAEEIPDGATHFKCAPPIREASNRERLWAALADGTLDMVVSDHSPCTPALKRPDEGDFLAAWGGISGLQLGLSVLWTEAAARGVPLERVWSWNSAGPARLAGLSGRKGALRAGADADLVVFDPEATFTVAPAELRHRHPITPYAGRTLRGVVHQTWVGGRLVYRRGEGLLGRPAGSFLTIGAHDA